MIDILKTFTHLQSMARPSGFESPCAQAIAELAGPYCDEVKIDTLGNVICRKKGPGKRLMMAAHMDVIGLIITHIDKKGFLRFGALGGFVPYRLIGARMKLENGMGGSVWCDEKAMEEKKLEDITLGDLYLDIGASSREEALSMVPLGTCGAFVGPPERFGEGLFKAKAIDDRIGCAIMLSLLKEELPMDVTFAFTAQEEVGTRGAFAAAFSVKPDIALVLETTTAADLPGVEDHRKVCAPGKGPVISYMDGATIYDRGLFRTLTRLAEEHDVPWQTKEYIAGGNDARTIQRSRAGVRVAAMSAAVRYLHAPASVANVEDMENMLRLTRLFLEEMARDGAER